MTKSNRLVVGATASDKVYQLLAYGRWFSLGTPASSTTKTGRHDITEILLKVTSTRLLWKDIFVFICRIIEARGGRL
jgi:hypothetical protein